MLRTRALPAICGRTGVEHTAPWGGRASGCLRRAPVRVCCRQRAQPPEREQHTGRRTALLSVSVLGLMPDASELMGSTAPSQGSCTECVGLVDDTLGTCASFIPSTCVSTFDDRPPYFVNPWEYPDSAQRAAEDIREVVESMGGNIVQSEGGYTYATFADRGGGVQDDVELYVSERDASVVLRAAARVRKLPDGGRNARRLESIRRRLGWDEVPILRNRKRKLLLIESPWDDFGPTPPPGADYNYNVDDNLLAPR